MTVPETSTCQICGSEISYSARYPEHLCRNCTQRATDVAGRPVSLFNVDLSGGIKALNTDGTPAELETDPHGWLIVYVDGLRCLANEARFGGIVVKVAGRGIV